MTSSYALLQDARPGIISTTRMQDSKNSDLVGAAFWKDSNQMAGLYTEEGKNYHKYLKLD